ncbi:MAG: hypothetical protein KGL02_10225, partial [Acidobacteriota bacterium]|nr:hypothetical protein [Acidobacteriota bacterium]
MNLSDLDSLAQVSHPILSLYLEGRSKRSAGGRAALNSRPWLKKQAKLLAAGMNATERKAFQAQFDRAETFLKSSPVNTPLAIFATEGKWICLHLPSPASNELQWGTPALTQIRRIAEEQQRLCIIAVDRAGARFFHYELGELAELSAMKFEIDVSQWKRREHGHMARRNTKMPHGPLRDAFKRRMDEQYKHFFRHIAERIKFVCASEHSAAVLLVGPERMTKPIESA